MAKKKKNQGHYCRICGEYLPNEKFSGKRHAQHVCKVCLSLPQDVQADMERCNEIEKIISKYPMSSQDGELLERYALLYQDKDSGKYAQEILEMKNEIPDSCEVDSLLESFETGDMAFSELEDDIRYEVEKLLENHISDFMQDKNFIPEERHLQEITGWVLKEVYDAFLIRVIPDERCFGLANEIVCDLVKGWKEDGFEIKTYSESLVVTETERLVIRRLTGKDVNALHSIMKKQEVMYAWEHGFAKGDVRKWINRQLVRYHKDGIGYYALCLKENGTLIGQAGLMKSTINGEERVELGYILDNAYWHQGYALEAAHACLDYAFRQLELPSVCCSIRPENEASIRVAERLDMSLCGEHTVTYRGKDMLHLIYERSGDDGHGMKGK